MVSIVNGLGVGLGDTGVAAADEPAVSATAAVSGRLNGSSAASAGLTASRLSRPNRRQVAPNLVPDSAPERPTSRALGFGKELPHSD